MKNWDAIVVGGGIIGLSLAIELQKRGLRVLVVDRGEPGREASWAAGGMLCDSALETQPALRELAAASARMYPEFVEELELESRRKIDLRAVGTVVLGESGEGELGARDHALPRALSEMEPEVRLDGGRGLTALYVKERCVDPRDLTLAAVEAARHRGVEFSSGDRVLEVEVAAGRACGVRTEKRKLAAGMVVNCAGAWAGQIGPGAFPVRPVKGQMVCVAMPEKEMVRHVVRAPEVYMIPRSDGRLAIGATVEEAGFDKKTVPETIERLRRAAMDLVPRLAEGRILEAWAGLRPGTPDKLPILGTTATAGYFVATGHFRDGILLAPVTGRVMARVMTGQEAEFDLSAFGAGRFQG